MITDVCNCEYTSHGHCGLIINDEVDNDPTLEWLARSGGIACAGGRRYRCAFRHDGRPGGPRSGTALDDGGFHEHFRFLSYAAKYASAFYGPFREAAESTPQFGDRRSYQMDPANSREALREIELDIEEGADMIMVKPALAYLDIIRMARDRFDVPMAAYQVSGEFSMIMAAARQRLDRPGTNHAGVSDLDPPRRGRLHLHVFREGRFPGTLKSLQPSP